MMRPQREQFYSKKNPVNAYILMSGIAIILYLLICLLKSDFGIFI